MVRSRSCMHNPLPSPMQLIPSLFFFSTIATLVGSLSMSSSRRSQKKWPDQGGGSCTKETVLQTLKELLAIDGLPRLIVFDLDYTMWKPELFQLQNKPTANKDIHLFSDALAILECFSELQQSDNIDQVVKLAIASRTHQYEWALSLLDSFSVQDGTMRALFSYVQIRTGSKRRHFEELRKDTDIPFDEMLFLDDDEYLNLGEVSSMGVLSCHTPEGLTLDLFEKSLRRYRDLKDASSSESIWMGHVVK